MLYSESLPTSHSFITQTKALFSKNSSEMSFAVPQPHNDFPNYSPEKQIIGARSSAKSFSNEKGLNYNKKNPADSSPTMESYNAKKKKAQHSYTYNNSVNSEPCLDNQYLVVDAEMDMTMQNFSKKFFNGWIEIFCNVIGTLGFFIGSVLWVTGGSLLNIGTLIFAGANVLSTVSCIIYSVKFYVDCDLIGVFSLVQQSAGCIIFAIHCVAAVYWKTLETNVPLLGFLIASILCFSGCVLTQVQCQSVTGVMAKLWPAISLKIIPTSLCNTVGAFIFCVGSYGLFFPVTEQFGAWCYAIGSLCYIFAAWGDATIWWSFGATQRDHISVLPQHNKFLDTKFK